MTGAPGTLRIDASDFRRCERGTLLGFVTLTVAGLGLVIDDVTVHRKNDERWVGMPARPVLTKDRQLEVDPATGKIRFASILNFTDSASRRAFQDTAVAAARSLLAKGRS